MTKATIVPRKIASKCHACKATPSGAGKNQTIRLKEIGKIKVIERRILPSDSQLLVEVTFEIQLLFDIDLNILWESCLIEQFQTEKYGFLRQK